MDARRDAAETVRDAHSLYIETLAELGIVGLLLLLAFLGWVLVCGIRFAVRSEGEERSRLAAALAGFCVFLMTAAVDWMWQVPVVPVAALLLACGLLVAHGGGTEKLRLPVPWRVGAGVASALAIVAIAIPLASLSLVRESQAEVRTGELSAALDDAQERPERRARRGHAAAAAGARPGAARRPAGGGKSRPRGDRSRVDQLAAVGWCSRGSPPSAATTAPRSALTRKHTRSTRTGKS